MYFLETLVAAGSRRDDSSGWTLTGGEVMIHCLVGAGERAEYVARRVQLHSPASSTTKTLASRRLECVLAWIAGEVPGALSAPIWSLSLTTLARAPARVAPHVGPHVGPR